MAGTAHVSLDQRTEAVLRDGLLNLLRQWPLYTEQDHVEVRQLEPTHDGKDRWYVGYCGRFEGRPFTPDVSIAEKPPNLLNINIEGDVLYVLFIQVHPDQRGKGYGDSLYRLCEQYAWLMGCNEIRQTPSGGFDQPRDTYLLKRGWLLDGNEVYKRRPAIVQSFMNQPWHITINNELLPPGLPQPILFCDPFKAQNTIPPHNPSDFLKELEGEDDLGPAPPLPTNYPEVFDVTQIGPALATARAESIVERYFTNPTDTQAPPPLPPPVSSVEPGLYRHYKGGLYEVISTGHHSETHETLTAYRNAVTGEWWFRPPTMFAEMVRDADGNYVPRFTRLPEAPVDTPHHVQGEGARPSGDR